MKLLTCLLFIFAAAMATPKDINEYFEKKLPSSLKWAHAVNSVKLLDEAIEDDSIHMIEADVRMGKVEPTETKVGEEIPIMAHDGEVSDLSLKEFLNKVKTKKDDRKVGIKLDFKDINAYEAIDTDLQGIINGLDIPVLFNADVVKGPGKDPKGEVKISAKTDIKGVLYSLGWTTGDFIEPEPKDPKPVVEGEETKINEYTPEDITRMQEYLKANKFLDSKITFPVRAMFLSRNVNAFNEYFKDDKYTLTVWSGKDDDKYIDIPKLSKFLLDRSKKVFIDIPKSVQTAIDIERNGATSTMPMAATILAFIAFAINYFK